MQPTTSSVSLQEIGTHAHKIQDLPDEVKIEIFRWLPDTEAAEASLVCKEWNALLNDDSLWKFFAARQGLHLDRDDKKNKEKYFREKRICENWAGGIFEQKSFSSFGCRWSEPYITGRKAFTGHRHGAFAEIDLDTGCHATFFTGGWAGGKWDNITHLYGIGDKKLIVGYDSKQINIWSRENEKYESMLVLESKLLSLHAIEEEQVILGLNDNTIQLWDLKTDDVSTILNDGEHSGGIIALCCTHEGSILSLDGAGMIKEWSLEAGTCERTFSAEETGQATHLCMTNEGSLVVGNARGEFKVLNLKTGICERDFCTGKGKRIISLYVTKQEKLIACDNKCEITIWDLKGENIEPLSHISLDNGVAIMGDPFIRETELIMFPATGGMGRILDFSVSRKKILEDIAAAFEGEEQQQLFRAKTRFAALPDAIKEKIYEEFDRIVKDEGIIWCFQGSGKEAFCFRDPDPRKAQAIRNYLRSLEEPPATPRPFAVTRPCVLF